MHVVSCIRTFVFGSLLSLAFAFPAFALPGSATPSDAGRSDMYVASPSDAVREELTIEDELDRPSDAVREGLTVEDELDLMKDYLEEAYDYDVEDTDVLILAYVRQIADSLSGPGTASSSDASYSQDEMEASEDIQVLSLDASNLSLLGLPTHDVVCIKGTFGGDDYTLVIPADTYPYLWIGDDGVLYNISSDTITGRLFAGGTFDSTDYEYDNLVLSPILGQSANTLYSYNYLSYLRHYYQSSGRLTSSTTYGNFYVSDDGIQVQRSLQISYRIYYVAVVSLFALGVNVLCLWKTYRR